MKKDIVFHLKCSDFPGKNCLGREDIYLAQQKNQELIEDTPGNASYKTFEFVAHYNMGKDGSPNFLGPFIFGKTGDKFLYLVWYNLVDGQKDMFRRAKIKLNHLSWEEVNQASENKRPLVAEIKLMDKFGDPVCASLKESHIQWKVK